MILTHSSVVKGAALRRRRHRGGAGPAIGRSRGGRPTRIHALTDGLGRPVALHPTGGQAADCGQPKGACRVVHVDTACDVGAIRRAVEARIALANIPPTSKGRWKG